MSKEIKVQDDELRLNQDYKYFLTDIKTRLQTAQIRAALAANSELIKFYWELGMDLIEKQKIINGDRIFLSNSHMICGRHSLKCMGGLKETSNICNDLLSFILKLNLRNSPFRNCLGDILSVSLLYVMISIY